MEGLIKEFDIKIPIETFRANEDPPSGIGLKVWEAAFNGNYDDLKELVDEWNGNQIVLNWQYNKGSYGNIYIDVYKSTPLMAACIGNCIKCIILLVNTSGVNVNLTNYCGTALWVAVNNLNPNAVEVLLKVKEIDIQKEKDNNCGKPLELAQEKYEVYSGYINMITPENAVYREFNLKIQKISRIIKSLEAAIRMKEYPFSVFSPRMGEPSRTPVPLKRRPSNVVTFDTTTEAPPEKLPTITLSIHGHGRELPNLELIRKNYKQEELDVRVFSAASELNVCAFHFENFEKKVDDTLVTALKNNSEKSSYDIIKEAIEPLSEKYKKDVADFLIKSGKWSKERLEAKLNADNTWHTYIPLWDKEYSFNDPILGNWIHVLNRSNIEGGHVFNEDPDDLINLVYDDGGAKILFDDARANGLFDEKKLPYFRHTLAGDLKKTDLSSILRVVSSYGFKVINIIDHSCRVVDTNKFNEEEIKQLHDEEKAQPINRAHGGNTFKKKRKSKKNKRKRKSKKNKK